MKDLRFGEIIDEVLTQMGLTRSTVEPEVLISIKLRINQIQDFIFYHRSWEWRKQNFYFSTRAPITSTGFTVTKGSRDVISSDAVLSDIIKFGFLRVNGKSYRVDPISAITSTTFKIMAAYPEKSEVSTTAEIVFPNYILDPEISSIISIKNEGRELRLTIDEKVVNVTDTVDKPTSASIGGMTEFIYHKEGTVTLVRGGENVVGVGTEFTSDMEGQIYRTNEFAEPFIINNVIDGQNLSLRDPYTGPSGSGRRFEIGPKYTPLLTLKSTPNDFYFMEGTGLAHPKRLIGETQISRIPNHSPLLHGSVWLALHDLKSNNPFRIQQARADFERTLKQLQDSNKVVTNVAWQTNEEHDARQVGLNALDPLDFFKGR